ncbi:MAG: DNA-3-methyladenine glycosylase 2 family protein [Candidatus Marinimicrobia bacterium]|nr:DNA-3-methyladenine glycosylase 2 family protein [Candidatus Neomarinimicrobiota bacterium]
MNAQPSTPNPQRLTLRLRSNGPTDLARCNQPVTENQKDREAYLDGTLYRASRIDGVPVVIRARSVATDELAFEVSAAEDSPLPAPEVVQAALKRKFSLDLDLPAFYRFVSRFPQLAPLAARQNGLRPLLKDSLLEALCLAVADQQVNVAFAARLKHRLLESYGRCYHIDGLDLWLFPTIDELAALDPHALCALQFTRNKSSYIVGLARQFLADPNWAIHTGSDDEIVQRLCTLRGVGRWTAEYAAMVGLGLVDTLPAADIALMRMVQQVYDLAERPTDSQVREIGRNWSPWRGLVTFYLWYLEDTKD